MNNQNILKELIEILKKSTQYQISTEKIIFFLLGNQYENHEDLFLSQSQFHNIATGKEMPSQNILSYLAVSDDWTIERLLPFYGLDAADINKTDFQKLTAKTTLLYNHYFSNQSSEISFSQMIQSLLWIYFFNATDKILFYKYTKKECTNYIPWQQKLRTLKSLLTKENIIFINGLPGTGKKQLVKYFISQECYNPYNVAWIDVTSSDKTIKKALTNAKLFLNPIKSCLLNKLFLLKNKGSNALLIISIPYLKNADLKFIDNFLIPTNVKCIIVTRRNRFDSNRSVINLDTHPVSILKHIFSGICPDKIFTAKEFDTLSMILCYNPLAISLVAKMLSNVISTKSKAELGKLKESLLDSKSWIWNETNLPKIHSSYKAPEIKTGVYITAILKRMLSDLPKTKYLKTLPEIALWSKYPVSIKHLRKICSDESIKFALTYSLLQFNDSEEKYVVMPTLIAETILDRAPLYFSDYEPTLRYVLCKISVDEILPSDFSSIYQTIMNVIYYFQPNAAFLKARPSKTDLTAYNNWNTFLLDIITYFYTLGNTVMADDLISELYLAIHYNNKKKNEIMSPIQELKKNVLSLNLQCTKGFQPSAILQSIEEFQKKSKAFRGTASNLDKFTYLDSYILEQQINNIFDIALEQNIVLEHNHTDNLIINRKPFSQPDNYILAILDRVNIIENYGINTNITENLTYYYRMMITYYILALYNQGNIDYVTCADNYYRCFVNHQMVSGESKFRASIHRLHYNLVLNFINHIYHRNPITYETYRTFASQYEQLYRHYKGRIHNNINMQSFYSVTAYYIIILGIPCRFRTCSYYTLYMIKQVIKDYNNFVLKQSTVSPDEQNESLKLFENADSVLKSLSLLNEADNQSDLSFHYVNDSNLASDCLTDIWSY